MFDAGFLIKVVYFYIIAIFLAILEIQIEGKHGWAEKLPTWRPRPGSFFDRIFKKMSGQKELTGYHTALMIFLLLFMHWPFVFNGSWDIISEFEILAIFVLFTTVWDFLWFILNPHLSLHKFNRKRVWWHKKWLMGLPVDYYVNILASIALFVPEMVLIDSLGGLCKVGMLVGVNLILLLVTIIFYPKAY